MIKNCEICLKEFDTKGTTRKYCRGCSPETTKFDNGSSQTNHKVSIRRAYKKELVKLMGSECHHCGIIAHPTIYDLHHIDESTKEFSISSDGYTRGWLNTLKESSKCVLLCRNCHALHHIGEIELELKNYSNDMLLERIKTIQDGIEIKIKREKHYCKNCGIQINRNKSDLCKECYSKSRQTTERPQPLELAAKIVENGFEGVGREYGVSGNAIKKWCKTYNIPSLKKELKIWYNTQMDIVEEEKVIQKVLQVNKITGETINIFNNTAHARTSTGIDHIKEVCDNKRRSAGGYIWKYVD